MNHKHFILALGVLCWIAAPSPVPAGNEAALSLPELSARLRSNDPVEGLQVTVEVQYVGTQVDQERRSHALFMARDHNTVVLFIPTPPIEPHERASTRKLTGRIDRVELQDRDLRDRRLYTIWLTAD